MSIDDLKILKVSGTAIPIRGDNIDTDQITPADAMTERTFDNAVNYLFRDARIADPNHPLNDTRYLGASIMIVNRNFGSGSSRETAPQAITRSGIKGLVGESYAAIFEGNCRALGIPAVTATTLDIEELMNYTRNYPNTKYTIDLATKTLAYGKKRVPIDMPESSRLALIEGKWDALSMLKANFRKVNEVAGKLPYMNGFTN